MTFIIIIVLIIFFVFCIKSWKIQEQNKPENILDRCEAIAYDEEEKFFKNKRDAIDSMGFTDSEMARNNIKDLEDIGDTQDKLHKLNIHLQEKYKTDFQRRIEIWDAYVDWLIAMSIIYRNRINIDIIDIDDFWKDNDEQFLKGVTIMTKMINFADSDVLRLLKLSKNKIKKNN